MTMTATINDVQNNFPKYMSIMRDGYEIIIIDNNKEIGKIVPIKQSNTPVTDSWMGILQGSYSPEYERDKVLRDKYDSGKNMSDDLDYANGELSQEKWEKFMECINGFTDDFMATGREKFVQAEREML